MMAGRLGKRWRPVRPALVIMAALLGGLSVATPPLDAQTGTSAANEQSETPLRYREVYVPAERVGEFGTGYLPMRRDEFQQKLDLLNAHLENDRVRQTTRVRQAEYSARLEGDHLVAGDARLEITHDADQAVLLPLSPCDVAMGRPRWEREEDGDRQRPDRVAHVGLGSDGRLLARVERSGVLAFPWTLRGARDPLGGVRFQFRLPPCTSSSLRLELPEHVTPTVDRGTVNLLADVTEPVTASAQAEGRESPRMQQWLIQLGGNHEFSLQVLPDSALERRQQLILLRQVLAYTFSRTGVELQADFRLDVHNEPLRQLVVRVDEGLQVTAAFVGDKQIQPLVKPADDGTSQVVLEFPEPLQGVDRGVRVVAFAPLVTQRPWRLPGIRAADGVWQEATATLKIPETLVLEQLDCEQCRQSHLGPGVETGRYYELQYFAPDAAPVLVLAHRAADLQVLSGTTIDVDAQSMTAVVTADVTSQWGETFEVHGQVPASWFLDAVQTVPADALYDYDLSSDGAGGQRLRIQLRRAVKPESGVRLEVQAHRRLLAENAVLDAEQFRLVQFPGVNEARRLLSISARPPYQMNLAGDLGLTRLSPQDLTARETELVEVDPEGILLVDDSAADDLRVHIRSEKPYFAAEISGTATVRGDALDESYRIRCIPESSHVEGVLIHFSEVRQESITWQLGGESDLALATRLLSDSEQQAAGISGGETWEISLQRPRSVPFEIQASRTTPLEARRSVALVSLPEAASQTGKLAVHTADGSALSVEQHNLKAIPADALPVDRYSTARAVFRYEPLQDGSLWVSRADAASSLAAAWAWSCRITSHLATDGVAHHTAVFRLENTGLPRATIRLPRGCAIRQVRVQGNELPQYGRGAARMPLVVPLPRGERYPLVQLVYTSRQSPLRMFADVTAPVPEIDLPVLQRHWSVWLPPSYSVRASEREVAAKPASTDTISWSRRLFGPLAPTGSEPFDLFSSDDWQRLIPGRRSDADEQDGVTALLSELGRLAQPSDSTAPTWGALLRDYQARAEKRNYDQLPRLLIHELALADAGITPDTLVERLEAESHAEAGERLLKTADLRIVMHDKAAVLTTAAAVTRYGLRTAPSSATDVASYVVDQRLNEQLIPAAGTLSPFVVIDAWATKPLLPQSPWSGMARWEQGIEPQRNWNLYEVAVVDGTDQATRVEIYHVARLEALAWAALLAAAGLVAWFAGSRPRRALLAIAAAVATALLVPPVWAPVGSGLVGGAVLGCVWTLVRRHLSPRPAPSSRSNSRSARVPAPAVVVLLALSLALGLVAAGTAQGPTDEATNAREAAYAVLIPTDDQQRPAGEYVHLPREFYEELHRRVARSKASPRRWLLESAVYRGMLNWAAIGTSLDMTELVARFQLQVFPPEKGYPGTTRVTIPLNRQQLDSLQARLNDQPIAMRWDDTEGVLSVDIPQPGRYTLEVPLRIFTQREQDKLGISVPVPPLSTARLALQLPADAVGVEIPQAYGSTTVDAGSSDVSVGLGPVEQLQVQWPAEPGLGSMAPEVEVEELYWLKVRPGTVVVDAEFRFTVMEGRLREARLLADPRLRLLPLRGDQPVSGEPTVEDGQLKTIHFPLAADVGRNFTLRTSFHVSGASGVGNLRLPHVEAVADRVARRWLAVSVASSLDFQLTSPAALERIAAEQFAQAWGPSEDEVQLAWPLPPESTTFSLNTQPRRPQTSADVRVEVSVAEERAEVRYDALLETTRGAQFQYRVAVPPDFRVSSVWLLENGIQRATRHALSPADELTVFLDGAVSGTQELQIRGELPIGDNGQLELPKFHLEEAILEGEVYQVFRRPDVTVKILEKRGLVENHDVQLGEHQETLGRLVAVLEPAAPPGESSEMRQALLAVELNRPHVAARLVTTLLRRQDTWFAELDYQIEVSGGLADVLRLEVPAELTGPLQLEPPLNFQVWEIPGHSRRQLVIRPPRAVAGGYRVRVQGRLNASPVRAPDVMPLDVDQLERYIVLPTKLDLQQIAWETTGLQAAPLPPDEMGEPRRLRAAVSYQVVGPRFQATIKDVKRAFGEPQVRLADVVASWRSDGSFQGVATFDLEPAGQTDCTLRMPPETTLVHATVANLPAVLQRQDERRWRLQLGPDQLPQRIEVVFTGRLPQAAGQRPRSVPAPTLEAFPVERTLWTLHGPEHAGELRVEPAENEVGPLRQEFFRLSSTALLIDLASDVVTETAPKEISDWYVPWARRLVASRSKVAHWSIPAPAEQFDAAAAETIDAEQMQVAARLGTQAVHAQTALRSERTAGAVDVWHWACRPVGSTVRCMFQGAAPELKLRVPQPGQAEATRRRLAAGLLASAMLLLVWLAGRPRVAATLSRWPHLLGVVLGLAWWLWLTPSVLGWLLVAISLWASVRPAWRAVPERVS